MASVVYLDVDDEITSAATRIRDAGENRVALVVPYGSRLATSRINFRLLAREAQGRGRELAVVAGDAATRALAASAGLAVFSSVGEYESAGAAPAAPAAPSPGSGAPARDRVGRAAAAAAVAGAAAAAADPVDAAPDGATNGSLWPAETEAAPAGAPAAREPAARRNTARADEPTTVMPVVSAPAAGPRADRRDPGNAATTGRPVALPAAQPWRRFALPGGRQAGRVAAALIALAVLALGVAAFVLLPSAEITLTTRSEAIGPVPLEIRADPGVTAPDPETATVPAQRLTFDVAVSDTFATEGKRVEATAAAGRVTFRSKDPVSENRIVAGAVVATPNGIRFRTTAGIVIPKATIVGLTIVPGEASVGIEAVEEGPEGNVEANAITVIPGGEDTTFTDVRNTEPTGGGTREEFPQVSQEDIDRALADLQARLDPEFESIVTDPNRIPPDLRLFPETKQLADPLPTTDPATLLNQEVPEFTLGLATTGTVIAVDEAPVETLARERISAAVEDGYELVEGSVELEPGDPVVDGDVITYPVDARAAQIRLIDANALRAQVKGKTVAQARTILQSYGDVAISVWPDWVTSVPSIDGRLTLTIEAPDPAAPAGSPTTRPTRSPLASEPPSSGGASPAAGESVDPGLEGEEPPP